MLIERILKRLIKEQPDDWEAAARKRRDAIFRQMMGGAPAEEEPAVEKEEEVEEEEEDETAITIDGESFESYEIRVHPHGQGAMLTMGRRDYYVFPDSDVAGLEAREYWEDMARNDPSEFANMVGHDTLTQWGMGQPAGPGSTHVTSLSDWLDLWLDTPEEHFASYDGNESSVDFVSDEFVDDELGFTPTVAYRAN